MHKVRWSVIAVGLVVLGAACSSSNNEVPAAAKESQAAPANSGAISDKSAATNPGAGAAAVKTPGDGASKETEPTPPAPVAVVPGTMRLVVLPLGEELLKSEQRKIDNVAKKLSKRFQLTREPPTDDEKTYYEKIGSLVAAETGPDLPAQWNQFETVVVMGVAPPKGNDKGNRVSQGVQGFALFRPPMATPAYLEFAPEGSELAISDLSTLVMEYTKEASK